MGTPGPVLVPRSARRTHTPRPGGRAATLLTLGLLLPLCSSLARASGEDLAPPSPREVGHSTAAWAAADLEALAEAPVWRALLHQARRRIDRSTREAFEEARFFYAADGARRPELELAATLEAINAADPERRRAARCRFPARHLFLAEHGLTSAERGKCPELDAWREAIGPIELTLIFPEAFLGNPSSMFGHTLLRFDPAGADASRGAEAMLGWTLDYTADAGQDIGFLYMLRGLFGGYRGQWSIAPYFEKTRVYNDWQDRDIWEYPLRMAPEARERVLLHVWELREVRLPYYFFTQNCSEKLLEILEVGWPDLGRGGGMPPTVTPVDTLRAMAQQAPDAVGPPRLRPSPATRLQDALDALGRDEAALAEDLALGRATPDSPRLAERPALERARLLTLAYDLLRHSTLTNRAEIEAARARSNALLRARSRLAGVAPPEPELKSLERTPPHEGHGTARVQLAGGLQDRDGFIELRAMPAFHTGLDAPGGFAEGGEIKFLDTALRIYPERERVRLHELVLLDITTASPWRPPFRPLAWHSEIGLRTRMVSKERGRGLEAVPIFRAQGGLGAALAPAPRLHLYAFGELVLEVAPALEGNASAGPLLRTGVSWSTRRGAYTIRLEGIAGGLLGRDPSAWLGGKLEQRVTLGRNWSATLGGHFERAYGVGHFEGRIGLVRYF